MIRTNKPNPCKRLKALFILLTLCMAMTTFASPYNTEIAPEFPGGVEALMEYLQKNAKYPEDALEDCVQGRVVVSFFVETDGSVSDAKVVKSVHPLLDKEALRVINAMPKWIPGKRNGKIDRWKYTLPVFIGLEAKSTNYTKLQKPINEDEKIYDVVEQMPDFVGGMSALMTYLSKNLIYPEEAFIDGIEGRVIISFVVEKDGSISNAKVVNSVCPSLAEEALRVVSSMPNWEPGKHNGKKVKVRYTLPIIFRIADHNGCGTYIIDNGSTKTASNSIKVKDPLVIVDDKEVGIEKMKRLDPSKISSVEVLKDKSATELYGDKGENGVVIITLKK